MHFRRLWSLAMALSCAALCGLALHTVQRDSPSELMMYVDVPRFRVMRNAQQLDQITHVSNTGQFGVSYDEGTVPRGLGGLGICNYMYCPDNHDGILRNPKQESTNPWSVKWDSWNWNNYDGDENVYTPSDCITSHLGAGRIADMPDCNYEEGKV